MDLTTKFAPTPRRRNLLNEHPQNKRDMAHHKDGQRERQGPESVGKYTELHGNTAGRATTLVKGRAPIEAAACFTYSSAVVVRTHTAQIGILRARLPSLADEGNST